MQINGLAQIQLNRQNVLDMLGRLKVGDVIRAKVLEMTSGELVLKLFDGTVFKAATAADIDTRPGETLELAITGKNDGSITLETVKSNYTYESSQNALKKLLISMSIAPEPENIALAAEFLESGAKISPEIFKKAAELIGKFSGMTPDKAVFLASRDIKPEEGRLEGLLRLLEGRLKIGKQLDDLQSLLNSVINAALQESESKAVRTASTPQNQAAVNMAVNAANEANTAPQNVSRAPAEQVQAAPVQKSGNPEPAAQKPGVLEPAAQKISVPQPADQKNTAAAVNSKSFQMSADTAETAVMGGKIPDLPASSLQTGSKALPQPIPGEAAGILFTGGKEETDGDIDLRQLKGDASRLESLKNEFKSIFVRTDSEDLKNEIEVKRLYKDITEKLDTIKSTLSGLGIPGSEEIAARASGIEEGIRLLNQLNSGCSYYQIPLSLSGFNTTGELYVIKRERGRRRIDPGDVTMFISLDTQNIGRLESVIDIKGRNISVSIRAEEQRIIDFIKENYKYLYNGLSEKGYRLVDIKYRLLEAASSPANIERLIKKELGVRTTVDIRI